MQNKQQEMLESPRKEMEYVHVSTGKHTRLKCLGEKHAVHYWNLDTRQHGRNMQINTSTNQKL